MILIGSLTGLSGIAITLLLGWPLIMFIPVTMVIIYVAGIILGV